MSEVTLIIGADGATRHLADDIAPALRDKLGPAVDAYRNGYVEPWPCLSQSARDQLAAQGVTAQSADDWFVDLSPVGGPITGPYSDRAQALQVEVSYLRQHNLPLPESPRDPD